MRDPVKIYFNLLKIQVKFEINLKLDISMRLVCLLIYLKINVLILLKEPSIDETLLTLHVTIETHILLGKT